MSVHKKLMAARLALQGETLKKSGNNKFAGYSYFELGDFLPTVQRIFSEIGLCGVVSYASDIATLTITDTDDGAQITVTSPMGSAALKGCHEVQNVGAVETYQRRYLWVTAMEIVEHDALDAVMGSERGAPEPKAAAEETVKEWIALVESCASTDDLAKVKKSITDEYGSVKSIPGAIKLACSNRMAALAPTAKAA